MDSCAQLGIAVLEKNMVFVFWLCPIHRQFHASSEIDFIALSFIDNYFGAGQFMILIDRFHCVQI